jgi:bZIP-type transcription factor MBZ1
VAAKANECNDLKRQNTALMEENARFRSLAEKLLAHPAFHPFLEDLSRDPSLAESLSKVTGNMSSSQMPKDLDPYNASQQFAPPPHSGETTVGMTLIPEVPLDLSALTLGTGAGWNIPAGRSQQPLATYQQSQVFAVTELPAGPVDPLDFGAALSGKGTEVEASFTEVDETEKATAPLRHDVPEVEGEPAKKEFVIDENDETMCLFASSAPKEVVAVAEPETFEPIFGEIAPEKAFAHFELFVSSEEDNTLLLGQFERMMARLDKTCRRLESLVFE